MGERGVKKIEKSPNYYSCVVCAAHSRWVIGIGRGGGGRLRIVRRRADVLGKFTHKLQQKRGKKNSTKQTKS
jgi:hypothetical protein